MNKIRVESSINQTEKKFSGFTLIEILLIIVIISILVSVSLVSLMSGRERARNNAAFASFRSLAAPAFACITSGSPTARLNAPAVGSNICSNPAATPGALWMDLAKYGWTDFAWCSVTAPVVSRPPIGSGYGGNFGGNSSGYFCFIYTKDSGNKAMWCTVEGCYKEGF